jgi:type IV pilus assembly protein PilN
MVRVNLLPDRKTTSRGRGGAADVSQLWILGVFGAMVLTIVVCLFIQKVKQDELAGIMRDNQNTQGQIDAIKKQIANHDEIKARLKELRDREEAIQKLQSARTGPTSTLLELAHVLTEVYNANWDPRRLWLTGYQEADRVVKFSGLARDGEDVSELERRLKLSDYFTDVRLRPGQKTVDNATHQELFKWELSAKVRY